MSINYKRIKELRESSGFRQEHIAEYLGVTQTYISKVETGERNMTADQLEKILNLYGYDITSYIDGGEDIQPIKFAFRAQDVTLDNLKIIGEIGKIAVNIRFMESLIRRNNDR